MLEIKPYNEWSVDHPTSSPDERLRNYTDYVRTTHFKNGTLNQQTFSEINEGLEARAVQDGLLNPEAGEEEYTASREKLLSSGDSFDSDANFLKEYYFNEHRIGSPEYAKSDQFLRYQIGKQNNSALVEDYKSEIAPIMEDSDLVRNARISAVDRGDFPVVSYVRADGNRDLHFGENASREKIAGQLDTLIASGAIQTSDLPMLQEYLTPRNGGLATQAELVRGNTALNVIDEAVKADPGLAASFAAAAERSRRSEQVENMSGGELALDVSKQVIAAPFKLLAEGIGSFASAIGSASSATRDDESEPERTSIVVAAQALRDKGYSEAEVTRYIDDYIKMRRGPVYRADKPQTAFDTDSNGNVLIAPEILANKPLFDAALEVSALNAEQKAIAPELRKRLLEANTPEMLPTILGESSAALDAYELSKASGKSDSDFVEEWLSNPDNYSGFSERAQQLGLSMFKAVADIPLGIFALFGSETAAEALADLDKEAADRQKYSRLFGDEYGLAFQVINTIPQVGTDILAAVGTGGTLTAAKVTLRQGLKGSLRQATKSAVSQLDDVTANTVRMAADTASGSSRAFSAIGDKIGDITGIAERLAPMAGVSFTRSASSTYGQLYGALPDTMSHEEKHKAVLGASILSGISTAVIVSGMGILGRGGLEDLATGTIRIGSKKVPIEKLSYKQLKLLHEKTKPLIGKLPDLKFQQALRANLGSQYRQFFRHTLKGGFDEGFEEMLDQSIQIKIQDAYNNQDTPFAEFANQIVHAGGVGGILGSGLTSATQLMGKPNYSDAVFAAEARFDLLNKTVSDLRSAGANITASALEEQLNNAARQLNEAKSAESAAQIEGDQADNALPASDTLPPEEGTAIEDPDLLPPDTTEFLMDLQGVKVKHGNYQGTVQMDGNTAYLQLDKPITEGEQTFSRIILGSGLDEAQKHVSRSSSIRKLQFAEGGFPVGTPFVKIGSENKNSKNKNNRYALVDPMVSKPDDFFIHRNENGTVVSITALNLRNTKNPEMVFQRTFTDPGEIRVLSRLYNLKVGDIATTTTEPITLPAAAKTEGSFKTKAAVVKGSQIKKTSDGSPVVEVNGSRIKLPPITEEGKLQVIPNFNELGGVEYLYFPKVFREGDEQRSVYVERDPARVAELVEAYGVIEEDPSNTYTQIKESLRKTIADLETRKARLTTVEGLAPKQKAAVTRAMKSVAKAEEALSSAKSDLEEATEETRDKLQAAVEKRESALAAAKDKLSALPGSVSGKAVSEINNRISEAQSRLAEIESGNVTLAGQPADAAVLPARMTESKRGEIESTFTPTGRSALSTVLNNDPAARNKIVRRMARQSWDQLTPEQLDEVLAQADYFEQQATQGVEDGSMSPEVAGEMLTTADKIRTRVFQYRESTISLAIQEAVVAAAEAGDRVMAEYNRIRSEADLAEEILARRAAGEPELDEQEEVEEKPLVRVRYNAATLDPDSLFDAISEYTNVVTIYKDTVSRIYEEAKARLGVTDVEGEGSERVADRPKFVLTEDQFSAMVGQLRTQAQQELANVGRQLVELARQSEDIDATLADKFEADVIYVTQIGFDKPVAKLTEFKKPFYTLDPERQNWSAGQQIDSSRTKFTRFRTTQEQDLFNYLVAGGHAVSNLEFTGVMFPEYRTVVGKSVFTPFSQAPVDRITEDSKYYNPGEYTKAKKAALLEQINELYPETGYLKETITKHPRAGTVPELNAKLDKAQAKLRRQLDKHKKMSGKKAKADFKKANIDPVRAEINTIKSQLSTRKTMFTYVVGKKEYLTQEVKNLNAPTRVLRAGGNPKNPADYYILDTVYAPYTGQEREDGESVRPYAVFTNNPAITRGQMELNMLFQPKPKRLTKKRLNPSIKYDGDIPVAFYAPWDTAKTTPIYGGRLPIDPRLVGREHKAQVSESLQSKSMNFLLEGVGPVGRFNTASVQYDKEKRALKGKVDRIISGNRWSPNPSPRLPITADGADMTMSDVLAEYEAQFAEYRLANEVTRFVLKDLTKRVRAGQELSPALSEFMENEQIGAVSTPAAELKALIKEYTSADQLVEITNVLGFFKRRFPDFSYDDIAEAIVERRPKLKQPSPTQTVMAYAAFLVKESSDLVSGQFSLAPTAADMTAKDGPFNRISSRYAMREKAARQKEGVGLVGFDEQFIYRSGEIVGLIDGIDQAHGQDLEIERAAMAKAFEESGLAASVSWDSPNTRSSMSLIAEETDPTNRSEMLAQELRRTVREDTRVEGALQELISEVEPQLSVLRGDALVSRASRYIEQGILQKDANVTRFFSTLLAQKSPAQRKLAAYLVAAGWLPPSRIMSLASSGNSGVPTREMLSMLAPSEYNPEERPYILDVSDPDAVIARGEKARRAIAQEMTEEEVREAVVEHGAYMWAATEAQTEMLRRNREFFETKAQVTALYRRARGAKRRLTHLLNMPDYGSVTAASVSEIEAAKKKIVDSLHNEAESLFGEARKVERKLLTLDASKAELAEIESRISEIETDLGQTRVNIARQLGDLKSELNAVNEVLFDEELLAGIREAQQNATTEDGELDVETLRRYDLALARDRQARKRQEFLVRRIPELEGLIASLPTGKQRGWKQISAMLTELSELSHRKLQLNYVLDPNSVAASRREVKELRAQAEKASKASEEIDALNWVSMVNRSIEEISSVILEADTLGNVAGRGYIEASRDISSAIRLAAQGNYRGLARLASESPAMLRAKAKRGDTLTEAQRAVLAKTGGLSPAEAESRHLQQIDKLRARLREDLEDQGYAIADAPDTDTEVSFLSNQDGRREALLPPPAGEVEFVNIDLGVPAEGEITRVNVGENEWVSRSVEHSVNEDGYIVADIKLTYPNGEVVETQEFGSRVSDVLVKRKVKHVRVINRTQITYTYMDGSKQVHYMEGAPRPAEMIENVHLKYMRVMAEAKIRAEKEYAEELAAKARAEKREEVEESIERFKNMSDEEWAIRNEQLAQQKIRDTREFAEENNLPLPSSTIAPPRASAQMTQDAMTYEQWTELYDVYAADLDAKEAVELQRFLDSPEAADQGVEGATQAANTRATSRGVSAPTLENLTPTRRGSRGQQAMLRIFPSRAVFTGQSAAEILADNQAEASDLGLLDGDSPSMGVALQRIARTGTPNQRAIASALLGNQNLIQDTNLIVTELDGTEHAGFYDADSNTVVINLRGSNGQGLSNVLMHELVHAATIQILTNPRNEAQRKMASRIYDLRRMVEQKVNASGEPVSDLIRLGLENGAEFVTHALTTPEFQALLRGIAVPSGQRSIWRRILDAIASIFGINTDSNVFDEVFNFTKMSIANGYTFNMSPAADGARRRDMMTERSRAMLAEQIASRFENEKGLGLVYAAEAEAPTEQRVNVEEEIVASLPAGFDYETTDRMLTAASVRGETTVLVNLDQMNAMIRGLNPRQARVAIQSTIDEEIAHIAADSQFSEQDYSNLATQLGKEELDRLAHEYFSTAQDLDYAGRKKAIADAKEDGWLTDSDLAAEWVRQKVSKMATGTTREADLAMIYDSPTLLQKFINALREFITALKGRFTAAPTAATAAKISQASRVYRKLQNGGLEPAPERSSDSGDAAALLASLRNQITPGQESRVRFAIPIVGLGTPDSKQLVERFWDSSLVETAGIYNVPMAVREIINDRNATLQIIQRDLEWFNKKFTGLRDEALEAGIPMEDIVKVLGTTEPILTDEARRRVSAEKTAFAKTLPASDPEREQKMLENENELYHREANAYAATFRIEQQAMEEQLTAQGFGELVEYAVEFRQRMNEHKTTIGWDSTNDVYLSRSYRYFNTPGWAEAVSAGAVFTSPDGTEIDFGARRLLAAKAMFEEETTAQLKEEGLPLHPEIIEQRILEKLDDALLKLDERHAEDVVSFNVASLRQDINMLKKKNEVDSRLRELLGEVRDPVEIVVRTMYGLGRMAANKMFYDNFEKVVLREGLGSRSPAPGMVLLFSSKQSDQFGRLAGLHVREDIAATLREELERHQSPNQTNASRAAAKVGAFVTTASGLAITMKTAGGVGYWVRNIIGGGVISLANGMAPLSFQGRAWQNIQSAFLGNTNRGTDREQRDEIRKLIDLGMLRDDTRGRAVLDLMRGFVANADESADEVFKAILKAQMTGKLDTLAANAKKWFGKALTLGPELAASMNNFVDSYFKINAFYKELEYLQNHYQDQIPQHELEARAARKVKLTFPTHSQTLDWVNKFNRSGWAVMFVPFLRWKTEVFRTLLTIPQLAVSEMRNGEFGRGFRRLAGFSTVLGGGNLIAGKAIAMLFGMLGDEEEEKGGARKVTTEEELGIRLGLPKWQRQHALYITNLKSKIRVIDLTSLMPYSQLTDMVQIGARNIATGRGIGIGDMTSYVKNELLGMNIAATPVVEVLSNRNDFGEQIIYEEDATHTKLFKMLKHVGLAAYEPGVSKKVRQSLREGEKDALQIWVGELTGTRPYEYDKPDIARRGMYTIKKGLDGVVAARRPLSSGRRLDYEDIPDIYEKQQAMLNENQRRLGQFLRAMESMGIEPNTLYAEAKKAQISIKKVGYALENKQIPWIPNADWFSKARDAINLADEGENPVARFDVLMNVIDNQPDVYDLND